MGLRRKILISGCPRSGTSWVHFLISNHPDAITCRETHLYDKYISPLKDWFDKEKLYKGNDGLSALYSENEFIDKVLKPLVDQVFNKISENSEVNKVVVEKTPASILHHDLIHKIQNDVMMIFVVRDPRAVYASFKAGSAEAWGSWMKKGLVDFCLSWNKYVIAYIAAKNYWKENRLTLVKYEDLKLNSTTALSNLFDSLTLDYTPEMIQEIVNENVIEKLREAPEESIRHDKRKGFYRNGKAFGWVEELSLAEIKEIEFYCKDIMSLFGYKIHT